MAETKDSRAGRDEDGAAKLPLCPIHGKPAALVYMCCRGAKGGRSTSPAKRSASTTNMTAALAKLGRRRKPKTTEDHA
jgi:hypothetical protein